MPRIQVWWRMVRQLRLGQVQIDGVFYGLAVGERINAAWQGQFRHGSHGEMRSNGFWRGKVAIGTAVEERNRLAGKCREC